MNLSDNILAKRPYDTLDDLNTARKTIRMDKINSFILPEEMFINIFKNLNIYDFLNISQVCKMFHKESNNPVLWKNLANSLPLKIDGEGDIKLQVIKHLNTSGIKLVIYGKLNSNESFNNFFVWYKQAEASTKVIIYPLKKNVVIDSDSYLDSETMFKILSLFSRDHYMRYWNKGCDTYAHLDGKKIVRNNVYNIDNIKAQRNDVSNEIKVLIEGKIKIECWNQGQDFDSDEAAGKRLEGW